MTSTTLSATVSIKNPATGGVAGEVSLFDDATTRAVFERARKAQKQWASVPVKERKKIFLRYHDLVLENQEKMMDTIQAENGKNRVSAFEEVLDNAITARHYAYAAPKLLKPQSAKGALPILTKTEVEHAPIGVVGIIAPWNYPLTLSMSDAIPALLAGNAVVLKPDSNTPLTALLGAELLAEAGLPEGVFNVVPGPGRTVGQAIVSECDYLMFTGSTETGRSLAVQAAERLIDFSGELGGKNPLIITSDANPEAVVRGVINACFSNSGQLCISIERIYVHEDVADTFIKAFSEAVNAMEVRGDKAWDTDMGSLISPEHTDSVAEFVDDAVAKGAKVLAGGKRLTELGDAFYAPTVLIDVPESARLYEEEVFGPVVRIEVVRTHEEAIAKANDTDYGLNSSVFGPTRTARAIASQLETGTVNINEGYAAGWASVDAPMGGWKQSGVGRRHGEGGLLKFTESRTVANQRLIPIAGPSQLKSETWNGLLSTALKLGRDYLR